MVLLLKMGSWCSGPWKCSECSFVVDHKIATIPWRCHVDCQMLLATLTIWLPSDVWNLCSFHRLCLHKNTLTVTTNIKHILVPGNCPSGRSPPVLFVKDLPIYECSFFTEPFESITYLSLRQKVMLRLKLLSTQSSNRNCSLCFWLSLPGGCSETARTTLTIY